jgi:N-methylhydantoinase A
MSRIIGIDVGGTNTNAALLEDGNLVATAKYPTDHHALLSSAGAVLEEIMLSLPEQSKQNLELHLSTTLTTNAIVEGCGEPVAAILSPGPGVNLADLEFPFPVFVVKGTIDHRGRETEPLDLAEIGQTIRSIRQQGINSLAIVGKFSVRNPRHELEIAKLLQKESSDILSLTLGHRLSGRLNFPRRVMTAFLNAGVSRLQAEFAGMVKQLVGSYGIGEPIFLLKADGGTMGLDESLARPVETILSGPAASIMGTLALGSFDDQTVVTLDIGGTTTEIAVLVGSDPLTERDGAVIAGYRTLVPALFSRSIGLGGDSRVYWAEGQLGIGPERKGPPVALGGPELTPTDAVIALGYVPFGDRQKARAELERFGKQAGLGVEEIAERIVTVFCERAVAGVRRVFDYLNHIPVYTVSEVLTPKGLQPEKLIGMGGPAGFFIPKIAAGLGLPYQVLPYAEAANAVGAAASRPTAAINLRADTALGKLVVPELDELDDIRHAMTFDLKSARKLALEKVEVYAERLGIKSGFSEGQITSEEVFNVVRGFYTAGRIFSLTAQVKPGVTRAKIR